MDKSVRALTPAQGEPDDWKLQSTARSRLVADGVTFVSTRRSVPAIRRLEFS